MFAYAGSGHQHPTCLALPSWPITTHVAVVVVTMMLLLLQQDIMPERAMAEMLE